MKKIKKLKKFNKKENNICGTEFVTNYDKRYKCVDFELIKIGKNKDAYYEIHLIATNKDGSFTNLLKLHIKDAIEIKSIIDNLVYDANQDKFEG